MNIHMVTARNRLEALDEIGSASRVAIDTEFHAERRYRPKFFLVQVYAGTENVWAFDPLDKDGLEGLSELMMGRPWVVHGGSQDLRILQRALGGVSDVVLDTQVAAGLVTDHYPTSYRVLVEKWLGQEADKTATLSDWSRRPLSEGQLAYACSDVTHLFHLWDTLWDRGMSLGRTDGILAACRTMRDQALTPPEPREVWKTFDAAAKIDNASLRLLRELAAWRLDQAMERNQSPQGILSDGLVVKLARMQPESRQSLQDDRRIPDRLVRRYGDDVVRLTELAAGSDEDLTGRVARIGTESWTRLLFLNLCVDVLAQRESWAAKLVLPIEFRVRWALKPMEDRQQIESMLTPWRDALLGDILSEIGQGERAASCVGGAITLVNSLHISS